MAFDEKDNEKRAVLWSEDQSDVTHRGHITLNGKKHYAVLVKSTNKSGEPKHELMVSAGLLYPNKDPQNDNSPAFTAPVTVASERFQIALWNRQAKSGSWYVQGKLDEPKRNDTFPE